MRFSIAASSLSADL